jgi:hypothetical protein
MQNARLSALNPKTGASLRRKALNLRFRECGLEPHVPKLIQKIYLFFPESNYRNLFKSISRSNRSFN